MKNSLPVILSMFAHFFVVDHSYAQWTGNCANSAQSVCCRSFGTVTRAKRSASTGLLEFTGSVPFNPSDSDSAKELPPKGTLAQDSSGNCRNMQNPTAPCYRVTFASGCFPPTGNTPVGAGALGTHAIRIGSSSGSQASLMTLLKCTATATSGPLYNEQQFVFQQRCDKGCMGGPTVHACNRCNDTSMVGKTYVACSNVSGSSLSQYTKFENGCYNRTDAHGSPVKTSGQVLRSYSCSAGTGFSPINACANSNMYFVKETVCPYGCVNGACSPTKQSPI